MKKEFIRNFSLKTIKEGYLGNTFQNNRFVEKIGSNKLSIKDIILWKMQKNPQQKEKRDEIYALECQKIDKFVNNDYILWLGHSIFLININQISIITDPCFYDISILKRYVKLPCKTKDLNFIKNILISHDHRDHLDIKSIKTLEKFNKDLKIFLPFGCEKIIKNSRSSMIKMSWYQEALLGNDIKIVFLPTKHWSRRFVNDYNKDLWGSFIIIYKQFKIYFSGDTAYNKDLFQEIYNMFGDIDVCMLPIGAYSPSKIMKNSHMTPEEAFQAFCDLNGKIFLPMHYGTYDLSDEPLGEPISRIRKVFEAQNKNLFKELKVGEFYSLNL